MRLPPFHNISPTKRCLLVLDLNGTLLHRRRTNSSVNAHVYARPYLGAFLRYISHPAAGLDIAVWSSARKENVQMMVERAWTGAEATRDPGSLGRARFPDLVFAREDMLLTDRQFRRAFRHGTFNPDHNVRTTKDLRQLWLHLSQMRDEQLRAQAQEPHPAPNDPVPRLTELTTRPTRAPDLHDLHGPHDTILLDDSAHKARLQPNNHLALPTYGAAELRADANALTTPIDTPRVDEALLAVVGILSEMRSGRIDGWTRNGRVWSGPGSQFDPLEMWEQRQKGTIPPTPDLVPSGTSARASPPTQSLSKRLISLPGRPKSTLSSSLSPHNPDPPFTSSTRLTVLGETPQWFTCPPLVHAWVDHGRRVLAGLGITAEHECVRVWPGWRDGKLEILGRAKDDVPTPRGQGGKGGKAKEQGKAKGERKARWEKQNKGEDEAVKRAY